MFRRVRAFRRQSKVKQIDMYSRGALYVVPWFFLLAQSASLLALAEQGAVSTVLTAAFIAVGVVQAVTGAGLIRRALDHYLDKNGEAPVPRGRLVLGTALLALALCLLAAMLGRHPSQDALQAAPTLLMGTSLPPAGAFCLLVRKRVYAAVSAGVSLLLAWVPFAVIGLPSPVLAGIAVGALFQCGWVMLMARVTGWMLSIVWEVDAARAVQARLAVVEERLRFSRDMHDILGRNLAAIALKSELAVQLARRGSEAAADQMAEVQRIAQESQRELREVVRGYREADLHTELAGARGILTAAGIACRIDDAQVADGDLPPAVQSALAWAVREATTNVLRHADARRCEVRLRRVGDAAVLTVDNDGASAGGAGGGAGSGLAGLRERLAALGGTVDAAYGDCATFRVTARVPVGAAADPSPAAPPPAAPVSGVRRWAAAGEGRAV
ncbi:histidine kinase [Streptomyces luteosporeus]|uniref:Histidine kinase n=1 Tax=Streptomyces luteosporeus TaxID=173856 RepID=A0ABN3U4D6_9ACTN